MSASSADGEKPTPQNEATATANGTEKPQQAASPPTPTGFFSWIKPAIAKRRTLKTWTRCALALAGGLVLLVDDATLKSMGQAGFFASLVAMLLPPSMALSLFIMAAFTMLFGMLLGWAWGNAAMAAALHVQDKALLAQRVGAIEKAGLAANLTMAQITSELQVQAFHGAFLDPRVSAVYGAFLFIGAFFFGVVRARAPRLMLLGIFGMIVLDVVATTGPLLPTANYLLPKLFLLPTTYYLAIAITSLVVIFPESLNHVWLTTVDTAFFGPVSAILAVQSAALHTQPSDHAKWAEGAAKSSAARGGLSAGLAALGAQIGLIDLEISMGRLGPGDLKRLAPEIRAVGFRAAGLLAFQTAVSTIHEDDKKDAAASAEASKNPSTKSLPTHETRFAKRRRILNEREAAHGHALDDLVPILAEASKPLRTACEEGVKAAQTWFDECNSGRWTALVRRRSDADVEKCHAALVKIADNLKATLDVWRKEGRVGLIKPYERFFDPETGKLKPEAGTWGQRDGMFAVRSLFVCFVFCDTLDAFAARLHHLLSLSIELDKRRPRPRLWLPSGFGKLWRKLTSRAPGPIEDYPLAMGTSRDPAVFDDAEVTEVESSTDDMPETAVEEEEDADRDQYSKGPSARANPDARPPTSALGKLSVRIGSILAFFGTDEGVFAIRHAILTLALWIPAVVPRSAWFYYANKGLWALLMGQMGLATYAGDQLFSVLTRMVGTAAGLLVGMVIWYIAAPGVHGHGNPYAIVVVSVVFVAPFQFARVSAPPAQMMLWTMVGVTALFVIGYSWLDTHIAQVNNQGVGISLGWRRAVLVMAGFAAGGIMMLFPRPTSSRTLVRKTLAASLQELGCLFGQEVEAFLAEEAKARAGNVQAGEEVEIDYLDPTPSAKVSPKERRVRRVSGRVLVVIERLQALTPSLTTATLEPQVRGLWPKDLYAALHQKELKLATSLALLGGAFSKLDPTWCSILVERTPFLNPNLLSDVFSTIDILSHALSAGRPIPASLPLLRERLLYHETLVRALQRVDMRAPALNIPLPPKSANADVSDDDESEADAESHATELAAGKVDGASIGFQELSLDVLLHPQLPSHSTAVIALGSLLALLDDIAGITRELCGETTFVGLDALQREYQGREEAVVGTHKMR
ncbi:hypothetical protein HMN09_00378100 [Mycena chlorophos]|uniref:ER transporter 6TM N-terminal domain-containing protein n=1 Tax=Mycena chlorophos TaxID=658473 RepID=A0A8H6TK83_MYCCL|nr:hypothetical protein HMN09_00378100 [Mycena chlorophos]